MGAAKPDAWVEVVDKQTGLTYYWNKESGMQHIHCLHLHVCLALLHAAL